MYQILEQHPDFIVINKSPNVHFHSQDGSAGVVAQVEIDLGIKLYAVHRLDTPTSGLLILAKSPQAAAEFTAMFSEHKIQKFYLAIARGKPKKKQGWIVGDMAKSRRSMYKLLRTKTNPAITQFLSQSIEQGLRLYLLKPLSGKTHQLRVALSSIGVPILGDNLYGGEEADRCYLHAMAVDFNYQGRRYQFKQLPVVGAEFLNPLVTQQLQQEWEHLTELPWPKA